MNKAEKESFGLHKKDGDVNRGSMDHEQRKKILNSTYLERIRKTSKYKWLLQKLPSYFWLKK